jgi:hypothetical protein
MVDLEIREGVARIFLNRAEKVNALTSAALQGRSFERGNTIASRRKGNQH